MSVETDAETDTCFQPNKRLNAASAVAGYRHKAEPRARPYFPLDMSSSEELTDHWEMLRSLETAWVRFTEAYLNAHPGRVDNPNQYRKDSQRFLDLRNSILYRFESLAFHIDLIKRRETDYLKEFEKEIFRRDSLEVVRWASRDMKFLFDDIVFSTVSLFDHLGNAIGFVLLDEPKDNVKWSGILKWAKGTSSVPSRTAIRALALNDEWIRGVADYRNDLIHSASDTAGGAIQHHIGAGQARLSVWVTVPDSFVERIEYLKRTVPPEGMGVISAGVWLVGQTFDSTVELVGTILDDLALISNH